MKKILATNYSAAGLNLATLLLRLGFGILMIPHGYSKLTGFNEIAPHFVNFMGIGQSVSLGLDIFAEFFCSILLAFGLFTRLALIPLIITALVIVFIGHDADIFGKGETGTLFLTAYLALMITGPGKYSMDAAISRRK